MRTDVIQYRIIPVTRYIVTRYQGGIAGPCRGSTGRGEYDTEDTAYEVAYALCKAEHDRLGWSVGDERIQYPERLRGNGAVTTDASREAMTTAAVA